VEAAGEAEQKERRKLNLIIRGACQETEEEDAFKWKAHDIAQGVTIAKFKYPEYEEEDVKEMILQVKREGALNPEHKFRPMKVVLKEGSEEFRKRMLHSVMPRLTRHKPRDGDHAEGAGGYHKGAGCQILGDESQSRTSHSGSKGEDRLQVHHHRGEDKSSGEERPKVWTGRSCPTSTPFHDQGRAAKNRFRKIKDSCRGSKTDGKDGRALQEGNCCTKL
jgi:hypothetical protein